MEAKGNLIGLRCWRQVNDKVAFAHILTCIKVARKARTNRKVKDCLHLRKDQIGAHHRGSGSQCL